MLKSDRTVWRNRDAEIPFFLKLKGQMIPASLALTYMTVPLTTPTLLVLLMIRGTSASSGCIEA
jgi:hypothetical protein